MGQTGYRGEAGAMAKVVGRTWPPLGLGDCWERLWASLLVGRAVDLVYLDLEDPGELILVTCFYEIVGNH